MGFRSPLTALLVAFVPAGPAVAGHARDATSARIVIPKLGLDVPLGRSLAEGPWLYYRDADTIAIAGHRTTYSHPFLNLPLLRRGDAISVAGKSFRVRRTVVVRPHEVWVLRYRGLVLSACHPAGSAAYRFVVLAAPVDLPAKR